MTENETVEVEPSTVAAILKLLVLFAALFGMMSGLSALCKSF